MGSVIGGLKGQARDDFKKGIQDKDVQGWANTLSSGEAAKFVSSVSHENGKAISQDESNKVDQSVSDAQRADVTAQNAVAHAAKVEQQASSVRSVGGNAKVDQNSIASHFADIGTPLTRHAAQKMASQAGGHEAVVALQQAEEQLGQRGLHGEALEAAALTKIGMMNPETGLGIASQIYGDMGPGLKGMGAVQQGAQHQIKTTQGRVNDAKGMLEPAAQHAKHAEKTANGSLASGAANQNVPTITETPLTTDPHAFAAKAQGKIQADHADDVKGGADFQQRMAAVNNAPGMHTLSNATPGEVLAMLGVANAFGGAAQGVGKHFAAKALAENLGKKPGGGGPDGGDPPSGAPDKPTPGAETPPGSGSAEPSTTNGPPTDGAPGATPDAPGSPPKDYTAAQQAARDAANPVQPAETVATGAESLAEKRAAGAAGARAALSVADETVLREAQQAVLNAGEKFAAKTAAGTAVAAGAGATGIGAPIGAVIEVANVAMNADAAVDVAQALYTYAKTPGASEQVVSALKSTANSIMEQAGKPMETNVPNVMP